MNCCFHFFPLSFFFADRDGEAESQVEGGSVRAGSQAGAAAAAVQPNGAVPAPGHGQDGQGQHDARHQRARDGRLPDPALVLRPDAEKSARCEYILGNFAICDFPLFCCSYLFRK